ncbi:MAG: 3-oxoacyl-ACP reductase [Burkholderiales bacterium PBB5]|nr:MAG: 3-oxoacyl-ACP reductase [Burkholderiales bacterium PBB5]
MQTLDGKVALVTGGGTGIGAAVAAGWVAAGGRVVLMGRREAPLRQVAEPLGALVVTGDAADSAAVQRALTQAREAYGGVDVLVANAGGHGIGSLADTDDASWAQATRLNLDTAFVSTRELLPELVRRRGNVVVLSSLAGHFAGPNVVGYVTMKHALIGFTRSVARDYGRQGVRVNAVCPGWVRTDMADEQMAVLVQIGRAASIDDAYRLVTEHVPLGRPATPQEVADAVLFLASDRAAMVTGTSLLIDGGASAVDLPTIAFAG